MNGFFRNMLMAQYFRSLWKFNKWLCCFFGAVVILQVVFTAIKLNAVPLLLYGMYSEKALPSRIVHHREAFLDDRPLSSYQMPQRRRQVLEGSLRQYVSMRKHGGEDPVRSRVESRYFWLVRSAVYPCIKAGVFNSGKELSAFERWFREACSKTIGKPVGSVKIVEQVFRLSDDNSSLTLVSDEQVAAF